MERPIKRLLIAGGGTAGWMAAAMLSQALGKDASIALVESAEIPTVGVGEASIPPIQVFNSAAGIDEAEFMKATRATFKLGIEFSGWLKPGHQYMHPFGQPGHPIDGVSFHAYWLRARKGGYDKPLSDFWMSEVAAREGRFDRPSSDVRSPRNGLAYAYHFDAGLYAAFLRRVSEARGVSRVEGTIVDAVRDPCQGTLNEVVLADGRRIAADYFIDCTGFRALLIGKILNQPYEDWSNFLPADRAVAVQSERAGPALPYTRAEAHSAGWQWRIDLQHRTGNGLVYVSDELSEDAAAQQLMDRLPGKISTSPRFLRFTTGRRTARVANCLALGLASSFLEPLESTSIHFIQHALMKFLATFPLHANDIVSARLFNHVMAEEMEQVRDLLILHYHANGRIGDPLWDRLRHMSIPESLAEKIELFRTRGLAIFPKQTLFQEPNWVAVLLGQGVEPRGWDPLADRVPFAEILAGLNNIRAGYAAAAEKMPRHEDVLRAYAPRQHEMK